MSGTSVMTPPEVQASTTSWHVSEWRVGEGARVDQGQTLAILEDGTGVLVEVPSPFSGCLLQRRLEVGALIPDNHAELALIEACEHEVLHGGVCAECGQCVTLGANREESETVLAYTSPHLHIGKKAAQRLDQEYIQRLVQEKRLVLVLDLDHTLLHATNDLRAATFMQKVAGVSVKPKPPHQQEPSPAQLSRPGGTEDNAERLTEEELHSFYLDGSSTPYIIKLRPDVRTFLADVSQKYELHMYTMGGGLYAREIQRILDPDGKLFQERITSRDDFPEGQLNRKNLQRLFPYDDSLVVIVDDREDVWARQDGQPVLNLLHARPYYFFMGLSESYDRTSRVGQTKGRDPEPNNATKPIEKMVEKWRERDRADKLHMLRLGKVLEECHRRFYATPPQPACDTKVIVAGQLAELLKGCRLAFTGVFNCDPQKAAQWRLAQQLGAQCLVDVSCCTHLVVHPERGRATLKTNKARSLGSVFMVTVDWLTESAFNFKRESELAFALDPSALPPKMKLAEYRKNMADKYARAMAKYELRLGTKMSRLQQGSPQEVSQLDRATKQPKLELPVQSNQESEGTNDKGHIETRSDDNDEDNDYDFAADLDNAMENNSESEEEQ